MTSLTPSTYTDRKAMLLSIREDLIDSILTAIEDGKYSIPYADYPFVADVDQLEAQLDTDYPDWDGSAYVTERDWLPYEPRLGV